MDGTLATFPEFSFANGRLRRIRPDDIGQVYAGLSHPQVIAHYGVSYASLAATREQMHWYEQLLEDGTGIWWALADDDDALIGACGFNDRNHQHRRVEMGYWLLPQHWQRGLMGQALPAILMHAFLAMGVHRIHLDIEPDNIASWRLAEKLGFSRDGTLRDVEFKDGRYLSLHQYSLLATDQAARALLGD